MHTDEEQKPAGVPLVPKLLGAFVVGLVLTVIIVGVFETMIREKPDYERDPLAGSTNAVPAKPMKRGF